MRAFRRLLLLSLFAAFGVALALGVGLSSRPQPSGVAEAERDPASQRACVEQETRVAGLGTTPPALDSAQPSSSSPAQAAADKPSPGVSAASAAKKHGVASRGDARPERVSPEKTAANLAEEQTSAAQSPDSASRQGATEASNKRPAAKSDDLPAASTTAPSLKMLPIASAEATGPRTPPAVSSTSDGQIADPYPRLARLLRTNSDNRIATQPGDPPAPAAPAALPSSLALAAQASSAPRSVPQASGAGAVPAEPVPLGIRWPSTGTPGVTAKPDALSSPATLGQTPPAERGFAPDGQGKAPIARVTKGEGDNQLSINIQNADIREVLELLSEKGNLNILAGNGVQGKVSATLRGVDVDSALKAILRSTGLVSRREGKFIFVGTAQEFGQIEQSLDQIGTRVYRPNYVPAEELKTLITPLLTTTTGTAAVSTPPEKGISSTSEANGHSPASGDTLLVRDYEAVLAQVDQVVAEVDVRPMQVSIEAMILSVKLSDGNEFGVNFQLLHGDHMKFGWGTIPTQGSAVKMSDKLTVPATNTSLDGLTSVLLNGGLKFGYLDSNVGMYINALESIGDTNVIATPRVTVLNKQRAYVHIGEKLGYISTTVTETASTSSVEFLDVGTELRLRPYISRDGLIRMEVHPELSTGSVDKEENYTIPNKEVTEVTTNVIVRDGCTAVIGGLIRNQLATTATQVPVLGSLPLVGVLFRGTSETREKHEIIVLITPRIIYDPESSREGNQEACEYHRRQAVYAEKMTPFSKRWIAHRYFRLAQSAWAEGDRDRALRFAELSVHFDPLNRAAIDLRSDIWLNKPIGDHTSACPADAAASLDGQAVAPWLLNDLEKEPSQAEVALPHPVDPGLPGTRVDIKRPRVLQP